MKGAPFQAQALPGIGLMKKQYSVKLTSVMAFGPT